MQTQTRTQTQTQTHTTWLDEIAHNGVDEEGNDKGQQHVEPILTRVKNYLYHTYVHI